MNFIDDHMKNEKHPLCGRVKYFSYEQKKENLVITIDLARNQSKRIRGNPMNFQSLAHSKRNCKYHIVLAAGRQVVYGKIRKDIGAILGKLYEQKGIIISEAELCPDHVHMLLSIPPKYSVA